MEKAKRISRVMACRVKMLTSVATSHGWPTCVRPPWPAYSPSEFSRIIIQSRAPGGQSLRGELMPRRTFVGRTLAYCCSVWQIARRRPQREIWSGTSG